MMKISWGATFITVLFALNFCTINKQADERNKVPQPKSAPIPEGYIKPNPAKKATGNLDDCIDPEKVNPDAVCYDLYDPVCGCDGITYSNECQALNNGLKKWTKGTCN